MVKKAEEKKKKEINKINDLDPNIFDGKVNKPVLYQAVKMYQANQRQGSSSTKTRADVRGGGRKPWRQKGTGRARAGSIRSPLWKGGGIVFGPHPRDYHYSLPKKVLIEALRSSLNSKYNENSLVVVENIKIEQPKTKEFKKVLSSLGLDPALTSKGGTTKKALVVLDAIDEKLKLASRNLNEVALKKAADLSAMDVLHFDKLVLTKSALSVLSERILRKE